MAVADIAHTAMEGTGVILAEARLAVLDEIVWQVVVAIRFFHDEYLESQYQTLVEKHDQYVKSLPCQGERKCLFGCKWI